MDRLLLAAGMVQGLVTKIISLAWIETLDVPAVTSRAAREVDYRVKLLHLATAISE